MRDVQLEAALILVMMRARELAKKQGNATVIFPSIYGDITVKLLPIEEPYWYEGYNGEG